MLRFGKMAAIALLALATMVTVAPNASARGGGFGGHFRGGFYGGFHSGGFYPDFYGPGWWYDGWYGP